MMLKTAKRLLTALTLRNRIGDRTSSPWKVENSADLTEVAGVHRLSFTREVNQPLLLISEIQRSGGTFLSQLLDGHPQIHAHPYELKIGRPKTLWPALDLAATPQHWWESLKEDRVLLHSKGGYKKSGAGSKNEKPLPFIYSQPLQKVIFTKQATSLAEPLTQRRILDVYATSYFNAWIDYQGLYRDPKTVKYWSGFTPRLTMAKEQCAAYFRDYPDGFLLSVIRNPLSWFASARRHQPDRYPLQAAADLWIESTQAALRNLADYPQRVLLLHFDDLVKKTASTMQLICDRTGLTFNPCLLQPTFNGIPMTANSSFGAGPAGTILTASVERDKELEPHEISYLRDRTDEAYRAALTQTGNIA